MARPVGVDPEPAGQALGASTFTTVTFKTNAADSDNAVTTGDGSVPPGSIGAAHVISK